MKIFTTLDTIAEAWEILDEVGLSKLLVGKTVEFEIESLLKALLIERKLHKFLQTITQEPEEIIGKLEISEALGLVTDFFAGITGGFKELPGLKLELGVKNQAKTESPITA
jgi:hypothetical protein